VGRRMFRSLARLISDGRSIRPRLTRASEAPVPALVLVIFYWGLWRLAPRSPARWWPQPWEYPPSALKSRWRETWIFGALLASPKTCPSALRTFVFSLILLHPRQRRNNYADCERKQNSIAW